MGREDIRSQFVEVAGAGEGIMSDLSLKKWSERGKGKLSESVIPEDQIPEDISLS